MIAQYCSMCWKENKQLRKVKININNISEEERFICERCYYFIKRLLLETKEVK